MDHPTSAEAAAAIEELDAAHRAVAREGRRTMPVVLVATSTLVALDYAAKDHVPDRAARRATSAACVAAALVITMLDVHGSPVQPHSTDPADLGPGVAVRLLAAVACWWTAERALVAGLRASGLPRPNTVAGLALAALRPVGYLATMRLMPTPRVR